MLKLTSLDKTKRLIGYWEHSNPEVIKALLKIGDYPTKIIAPFRRELEINLLLLETTQGKQDLLKHYIFELAECSSLFKEYQALFQAGVWNIDSKGSRYATKEKTKTRKLTDFENYVVIGQDIFGMAFTEIQILCFKFKIDFIAICKDLQVDTSQIDKSLFSFLTQKQDSTPTFLFDFYLTPAGKRITRYLITTYKGTKPDAIAFMLFALVDLGLLPSQTLNNNQTQLHKALVGTFGNIGTRQNLNSNINKLRNPDDYQRRQIQAHTAQIKGQL